MNNLQKMGGYAALIEALTYIVGFAMVFTLLADYATGEMSNAESVAYIADNHTLLYLWHFIIYVLNGVFLVVLALAIHERLKDAEPVMSQIATAFGLLWAGLVIASGMIILVDLGTVVDLYHADPAQAELAWITLSSVESGLGGGIEMVGGLWALLLSVTALRAGVLPKALNYLGVLIGVAGVLTLIHVTPFVDAMAGIFGLGFIVWFVWVGIVLLRTKTNPEIEHSRQIALKLAS